MLGEDTFKTVVSVTVGNSHSSKSPPYPHNGVVVRLMFKIGTNQQRPTIQTDNLITPQQTVVSGFLLP